MLQEHLRAERPVITRAEFVGGRFFYAVEVDTSAGFELCPADVCAVDGPAAAPPAPRFRILEEGIEPGLRAKLEAFLAANGTEVARIEFIRATDRRVLAYDVNTNTNYNPEAEAKAQKFGMRAIARHLDGLLRQEFARVA